jgi:hypothetical protein
MSVQHRARRFWVGVSLALLVIVICFSVANALIPHWGSTPAEQAQALPGDEIFTHPVLHWVNGITIDAKPEEVWPWVAQMGDTRGGYYSYRFIEKAVTGMAGKDGSLYYRNTNQVHPEWQSPSTGQGMILDALVLRDIQANRYMVAGPTPEMEDGGLLWTWAVAPTADGRARLLVHMSIQFPGMDKNPAVETAMNLTTFMMERKMMEGIKLRAEGGAEADWVQVAEALIWLLTLGIGIAAARRYLAAPDWKLPLAIGLLSIVALFAWTYLQPALWVRVVVDLAMIGGLVWEARKEEASSAKTALVEVKA